MIARISPLKRLHSMGRGILKALAEKVSSPPPVRFVQQKIPEFSTVLICQAGLQGKNMPLQTVSKSC